MQTNPLAKNWILVDSVSVTGAGGSSDTKTITLPSSYTELMLTVGVPNNVYNSTIYAPNTPGAIASYTGVDGSGNITVSLSAVLGGNDLRVSHTYNRYGSSQTIEAKLYYR